MRSEMAIKNDGGSSVRTCAGELRGCVVDEMVVLRRECSEGNWERHKPCSVSRVDNCDKPGTK